MNILFWNRVCFSLWVGITILFNLQVCFCFHINIISLLKCLCKQWHSWSVAVIYKIRMLTFELWNGVSIFCSGQKEDVEIHRFLSEIRYQFQDSSHTSPPITLGLYPSPPSSHPFPYLEILPLIEYNYPSEKRCTSQFNQSQWWSR